MSFGLPGIWEPILIDYRYEPTLVTVTDATALRRGVSRLPLKIGSDFASVSLVEGSVVEVSNKGEIAPQDRVTFEENQLTSLAASVKLHGARPWHLGE